MKAQDRLLIAILMLSGVFFLSLIYIVDYMDITGIVMALYMSFMMFFSAYVTYTFNR